jgi:hypothetical protein
MSTFQTSAFVSEGNVSLFSASRITGYSRRMLRHLIETGELRARRKGKRAWVVELHDITRCISRRIAQGRCRKDLSFPSSNGSAENAAGSRVDFLSVMPKRKNKVEITI